MYKFIFYDMYHVVISSIYAANCKDKKQALNCLAEMVNQSSSYDYIIRNAHSMDIEYIEVPYEKD